MLNIIRGEEGTRTMQRSFGGNDKESKTNGWVMCSQLSAVTEDRVQRVLQHNSEKSRLVERRDVDELLMLRTRPLLIRVKHRRCFIDSSPGDKKESAGKHGDTSSRYGLIIDESTVDDRYNGSSYRRREGGRRTLSCRESLVPRTVQYLFKDNILGNKPYNN
ncbi:hypothetical protein FISHEDRAFT_62565 [Fistulina hepatica ATCC 64428]|nr:hypothetical protein FISHEDRAFT_62565 [Fistulina hepatica ATCC 64428]